MVRSLHQSPKIGQPSATHQEAEALLMKWEKVVKPVAQLVPVGS